MKYYLAIDIGASSGRHIVGWKDNNEIKTEEVYRFDNGVKEDNDHLVWDIDYLFSEVVNGIKVAFSKYEIESLSIDTWGVDYVLMNNDEDIRPVYAYRDHRANEVIDEVHSLVPFEILYEHTGCQFSSINTIYQLYSDLKNNRLSNATDFLMIPEYLMYRLTGIKIKEFTDATTTGLINHETLEFDEYIIDKLNLPKVLFKKLSQPKTIVGSLKNDIANVVGGNCKVVLCATHDTGSAVEGILMDDNDPYISSGTWSLLGVKTDKPITNLNSMKANYSNEGGVNYNRYQKNIIGLWLVQELRKEFFAGKDWNEIVELAKASTFDGLIDINDESFLAPKDMKQAILDYLHLDNLEVGDYFRCAYRSLAKAYKDAIKELEKNTGKQYKKIYIVGGGAKNKFLNDLTEKFTGKKVIALPIEATALGNLKIQMEVK